MVTWLPLGTRVDHVGEKKGNLLLKCHCILSLMGSGWKFVLKSLWNFLNEFVTRECNFDLLWHHLDLSKQNIFIAITFSFEILDEKLLWNQIILYHWNSINQSLHRWIQRVIVKICLPAAETTIVTNWEKHWNSNLVNFWRLNVEYPENWEIPGSHSLMGPPWFCGFNLQKLYQLLTVKSQVRSPHGCRRE